MNTENTTVTKKGITVTGEDITKASTAIRKEAEAIKTSLDTIIGEIGSIKEAWKDVNATQYLAKFEQLQNGFPNFYNNLCSLSEFLDNVVRLYQEDVLDPTSTAVNGAGEQ